jgi:hypothetical protein
MRTAQPTKIQGYLLWSKKEQVDSKMASYHDVVTYRVPVVGHYNRDAVARALYNRFQKPGPIAGSSWGNCSVNMGQFDPKTRTITVELSYGIGE